MSKPRHPARYGIRSALFEDLEGQPKMLDLNLAAKYAARSKHLSAYSLPDIDFTDLESVEGEELKLRPVNLNDLLRFCGQVRFETFESLLGVSYVFGLYWAPRLEILTHFHILHELVLWKVLRKLGKPLSHRSLVFYGLMDLW